MGAVVRRGEAVTVHGVESERVAAAVRCDGPVGNAPSVAVEAPPPGALHEYVGHVEEGMGVRIRTALAAAARTRGLETPHDDELAAARERLASMSVEGTTTDAERREAADAGTDVERLRERVAAARGRLQAAREHGGDVAAASEELASAVRDLSEAETRAAAAEERMREARERARERRDRLEERLRLEDRVANLERRARAHLVERVRGEFAERVRAVPGAGDVDPFDAPGAVAALAVVGVGSPSAPVVVDTDRFADAREAREWLDAPVIYTR